MSFESMLEISFDTPTIKQGTVVQATLLTSTITIPVGCDDKIATTYILKGLNDSNDPFTFTSIVSITFGTLVYVWGSDTFLNWYSSRKNLSDTIVIKVTDYESGTYSTPAYGIFSAVKVMKAGVLVGSVNSETLQINGPGATKYGILDFSKMIARQASGISNTTISSFNLLTLGTADGGTFTFAGGNISTLHNWLLTVKNLPEHTDDLLTINVAGYVQPTESTATTATTTSSSTLLYVIIAIVVVIMICVIGFIIYMVIKNNKKKRAKLLKPPPAF
jgi:hypothetical protein